MIKKGLSLLLCFVMLISCFSATAVQAYAAVVSAKSLFVVDSTAVSEGKLNYTISITAQQKGIAGVVLCVEYDSGVLMPVAENCGPCMRTNSTEGTVQNFKGMFEYGVAVDENEGDTTKVYTIGYMNDYAVSTGSSSKEFFDLEFQVIDDSRPKTNVKFYCKEYYSTEEADKVITPADGLQEIAVYENVPTLEQPELVGIELSNEGVTVKWQPVVGAMGYAIYRKTINTQWSEYAYVSGEECTEYTNSGDDLASGNTYYYTVSAVNFQYDQSSMDKVGVNCKYIAKPIVTEVSNIVGGISLKWTEIQGADNYRIMRRVYGTTQWEQIASRISSAGTTYIDRSVKDGVWYEYDVNSATDNYATTSAEYGVSINYVATPDVKYPVNTTDGIKLSWTASVDAVKYTIYRKEIGVDSEWEEYAQTNVETYTDTNVSGGKGYQYSIQAHTNDNNSGFNTSGVTFTFVPPVEVKSVTNGKYSVDIAWDGVENVREYRVYRKAADGGEWVKIGVVAGSGGSFSDTTATSGGVYVYAVCPVISNSESAKLESEAIYFIKAPGDVVATNLEEGIRVEWSSVLGATDYKVYKAVNGSGYSLIDTVSETSIVDTDVITGNKYSYKIQSVNTVGSSPESDASQSLLRIEAIGKATPVLAEGGINVTWDAVEGVENYAVYRDKGDGFVRVATVEENSYLDTRVESNVRYSYAVAAIIEGSVGVLNVTSPIALLYIAPPAGVEVQNKANDVLISWESVAGAQGYQLYKGTSAEDMELLCEFDAQTFSFNDSDVVPGMSYTYKLRTKGAEGYSMFTGVMENIYLEVPKIKSLANTYDGVKITWNESAGAESYKIYRRYAAGEKWTVVDTVDAETLSLVDGGAANGKRVYYTVKAFADKSASAYGVKNIVNLKSPEVTLANSTKGVSVKWTKIDGAKSYYVYRKTPGATGWAKIATTTANSYVDTKAKSGQNYIYTVRAVGSSSNSGYNPDGWSIRRLVTPTLKSAINAYSGVKISWSAVKGANKYRVYRKAEGESGWRVLGTTSKLYIYDKKAQDGTKYSYTVRAYYGAEKSSYNTKGVSTTFIYAPRVEIKNNISGVNLYWDEVDSASSYYVYRKAGSATSWKKIATVTKNTYTDTSVKSGTVYTYTVRAYGMKTLSGYSGSGWKTRYLNAPRLVSAEGSSKGITFTWKPVTGAQGYQIFRKETGGSWVRIATLKGATKKSYLDKNAVKGEKYKYTVRAYYGSYRSAYYSGVNGKR